MSILHAAIDWAKYPKLASIFEHRPRVNVYWLELAHFLEDHAHYIPIREAAPPSPVGEPAGEALKMLIKAASILRDWRRNGDVSFNDVDMRTVLFLRDYDGMWPYLVGQPAPPPTVPPGSEAGQACGCAPGDCALDDGVVLKGWRCRLAAPPPEVPPAGETCRYCAVSFAADGKCMMHSMLVGKAQPAPAPGVPAVCSCEVTDPGPSAPRFTVHRVNCPVHGTGRPTGERGTP